MVKLALGVIVFNGMPFIEGILETFYPYVSQIVVSEGPVAFWQAKGYESSIDDTVGTLRTFRDPRHKLTVIEGHHWPDKLDMANAWLRRVRDDIDYVACFDADEFLRENDIKLLLSILEEESPDSVGFTLRSFIGGIDYYLTGFEQRQDTIRIQRFYPGAKWVSHRPPTINHPLSGRPFRELHHIPGSALVERYGVYLYHYSHVLPTQVWMKELYYADYMGKHNVIPNYYQEVWKPWVLGNTEEKRAIEKKWRGIHDFSPAYRGDCYPVPFNESHPKWIEKNASHILRLRDVQMGRIT